MRRILTMCLSIFVLALSSNLFADAQLNLKQTQGEDKNQVAVIAIKQGKVRFDIDPKRGSYLLYSQADKTISYISTETKHYVLIDEKGVDTLVAVQKVLMSQMELELKGLPADGKNSDFADKKEDSERFLHTSKTRVLSGKTCKIIEQYRGTKKRADLCVVERAELGVSDVDYGSFKAFQLFVQDIMTRLPGGDRLNLNAGLFDRGEDDLPIQIQRFNGNKIAESYELESVSNNVDAAWTTVPEGFTRKDLASLFKK